MQMKNPIFVALDVDDMSLAMDLAKRVEPYVGGFKVGPRLNMRYGQQLTQKLAALAPVFIDNKYHDIPSTVEAAVKASFEAGASFVTVHASNGKECLESLAQLEKKLNARRPFKILAVTVLTSFDTASKPSNWQDISLKDHVSILADESVSSGLSGLVCSGEEVAELRKKFPEVFLLTPGIRLPQNEVGDQKRVLGPREALELGSSALVVGRPIVQAEDPSFAAQEFAKALEV